MAPAGRPLPGRNPQRTRKPPRRIPAPRAYGFIPVCRIGAASCRQYGPFPRCMQFFFSFVTYLYLILWRNADVSRFPRGTGMRHLCSQGSKTAFANAVLPRARMAFFSVSLEKKGFPKKIEHSRSRTHLAPRPTAGAMCGAALRQSEPSARDAPGLGITAGVNARNVAMRRRQ